MRLWPCVVIIVVIVAGCGWNRIFTQREQPDTVDHDFVATIQKTQEPYVFEISIRKTN